MDRKREMFEGVRKDPAPQSAFSDLASSLLHLVLHTINSMCSVFLTKMNPKLNLECLPFVSVNSSYLCGVFVNTVSCTSHSDRSCVYISFI